MHEDDKITIRLSHPGTANIGRFVGYRRFTKYVEQAIHHDPTCETTILICPPPYCCRIESCKTHILFTMWEFDDLPDNSRAAIGQADAIIVPTEYCKRVIERQYDGPIHVVPLPVDGDLFYYKARVKPKDKPFRWLYLNSMQERKGWKILAGVWDRIFVNKNAELYVKIAMGEEKITTIGSVTVDPRYVPDEELAQIYHDAHGFIYPSFGEGFGWSLAEAISTGLPAAAIEYSGVTEFFNRGVGFPIDYVPSRIKSKRQTMSHADDGLYGAAIPTPRGITLAMLEIMDNYAEARRRAKNGSELIRDRLSVENFQKNLTNVLSQYV